MVIQANSLFWRLTKADGDAAIVILRHAVERFPDYGPAHSMLAFMLLLSQLTGWKIDKSLGKQAETLAERAAELDDSDPWAHLALGYAACSMRRTDEAVEEFRRALDLNPNFAAAHGYLALALGLAGRSDEAVEHGEQAIKMSPQDPQNAIFNTAIAVGHYLAGRYAEAVVFGRKALQQRTQFTSGHRIYVASLAQAGHIDESREALLRLKKVFPEMTIAWIKQYVPYTTGPMEKFLEGMRKAGLE
jgi:tetratricopeptide (TPR) repeat protein